MDYIDNLKMDLLVSIRGINSPVVLKPVACDADFQPLSPVQKQLQALRRQLPDLLMYVGGFSRTQWPAPLPAECLRCAATGADPGVQPPENHFYDEVKLPALLQGFQDSWQAAELASARQKLKAADSRRVLCHTLKTYFDQNCDLSQTTKTLHIHTNTLRYRLQRVESITGLNINRLESMIQLYFGILTDL